MSQQHTAKPSVNLRAQVVKTLVAVQNGQSLTSVLNQQLSIVSERDRGLYHELTMGCLRQWYGLKAITLPLLTKPLDNEALESCLYLGLYQLLCTRIPAHAAISETVDAVKQLGFQPMSGLVNAVLRRVSRETEEFQTALEQAHGLPSWLFKRFVACLFFRREITVALDKLGDSLRHVVPRKLHLKTVRLFYADPLAAVVFPTVE